MDLNINLERLKGDKMKSFENIYILKGSLTEEQAKKEIKNIKQYFKDVEVFENKNDLNGYLGLKRLAYKIKGEITGYYYITYFNGTESQVTEIEKQLRLNDNVIKLITVRI